MEVAASGIPISIKPHLTPAQRISVQSFYPAFRFTFTSEEYSSHPMTAVERLVGEYFLSKEADYNVSFIDVGGSLVRRVKGVIHTIAPADTPDDQLRREMSNVVLKDDNISHCRHYLSTCSCISQIDLSKYKNCSLLFIHSLYYIKPEELVAVMVEKKMNAYSLHHSFQMGEHLMYDGEIHYKCVAESVVMKINRDQTYMHAHPRSLFSKPVYLNGVFYRLTYKVIHTFNHTEICFITAAVDMKPPVSETKILIDDSLFNKNITGHLSDLQYKIGAATMDNKVSQPNMVLAAIEADTYTVSDGVLYLERNRVTKACLPRPLYFDALLHIAYKPRTAANYTQLVQFVKRQVTRYAIPQDCMEQSITAVCSLAFYSGVESEINALAHVNRNAPSFKLHNDLLSLAVTPPTYGRIPVVAAALIMLKIVRLKLGHQSRVVDALSLVGVGASLFQQYYRSRFTRTYTSPVVLPVSDPFSAPPSLFLAEKLLQFVNSDLFNSICQQTGAIGQALYRGAIRNLIYIAIDINDHQRSFKHFIMEYGIITFAHALGEEVAKRVFPWWIIPAIEFLLSPPETAMLQGTMGTMVHYLCYLIGLKKGVFLHTFWNLFVLWSTSQSRRVTAINLFKLAHARYKEDHLATQFNANVIYGTLDLPTCHSMIEKQVSDDTKNYADTRDHVYSDEFIVKSVRQDPETDFEKFRVKDQYVKHVGIACMIRPPHVFTDSAHNQMQSLLFRQLRPLKMIHVDQWNDQKYYIGLIPKMEPVLDFDDWNCRFPANQQRNQNNAAMQPVKTSKRKCQDSSMMVKIETGFGNITLEGNKLSEKAPRCIISHNDEYNAQMGPYFWTFNKELSRVWNHEHDLFYASGTTPSIIGDWFETQHQLGAVFVECDAKFYDSSFTCEHREIEARILFTPGSYNHQCYLNAGTKRGYTKQDVFYTFSQRRASGAPETSAMNSTFTGIVAATVRKVHNVKMNTILCGDNSCFAILSDPTNICEKITDAYNRWAFTAKPRVCTDYYDIEFCSCAIWPTNDGLRAGVKPGRFFSKIAWSCKQMPLRILREFLIGSLNSQHHYAYHVPFAHELIATYRRLLKDYEPRYEDKYERFVQDIDVNAPPTIASYELFYERYSTNETEFRSCIALLDSITHLPVMIEHPLLDKMFETDL